MWQFLSWAHRPCMRRPYNTTNLWKENNFLKGNEPYMPQRFWQGSKMRNYNFNLNTLFNIKYSPKFFAECMNLWRHKSTTLFFQVSCIFLWYSYMIFPLFSLISFSSFFQSCLFQYYMAFNQNEFLAGYIPNTQPLRASFKVSTWQQLEIKTNILKLFDYHYFKISNWTTQLSSKEYPKILIVAFAQKMTICRVAIGSRHQAGLSSQKSRDGKSAHFFLSFQTSSIIQQEATSNPIKKTP